MFQVIQAVIPAQRAEEIRSRKDAAYHEADQQKRSDGQPASTRAARAPLPSFGQRPSTVLRDKSYHVPTGDERGVQDVLDRAVRTYSEQSAGPAEGATAESAVPFDTLKRASQGQLLLDLGSASGTGESAVPYDVLQRAAAPGARESQRALHTPFGLAADGSPKRGAQVPEEQLSLPWGLDELNSGQPKIFLPEEKRSEASAEPPASANGAAPSRSGAESALSGVGTPPPSVGGAAHDTEPGKNVLEPEARRVRVRQARVDDAQLERARLEDASFNKDIEQQLVTFEAPAGGGPPFGREVPFDMSAAGRRAERGSTMGPGERDLVQRMRGQLASERYLEERARPLSGMGADNTSVPLDA